MGTSLNRLLETSLNASRHSLYTESIVSVSSKYTNICDADSTEMISTFKISFTPSEHLHEQAQGPEFRRLEKFTTLSTVPIISKLSKYTSVSNDPALVASSLENVDFSE